MQKEEMTLLQLTPFNGFLILSSSLFFRMLVAKRTMANALKVTPEMKGRNPGPGSLKVPIWARIDSTQTIIEITSQKRLLS
jgi:hypothetical protein